MPTIVEGSFVGSSMACAMPKSHTFTSPEWVIMTFPGLMSRWMIPDRWDSSSASRIPKAMCTATFGSNAPASISRRRILPSMYSMMMKGMGISAETSGIVCSPASYTRTMFGCPIALTECASRWNRFRESASIATSGRNVFIATRRFNRVSVPT